MNSMNVFSVIRQASILENYEVGLYSSLNKALEAAEKIAKEHSYSRIDDLHWGEQDDYGLLEGVFVMEKEVQ